MTGHSTRWRRGRLAAACCAALAALTVAATGTAASAGTGTGAAGSAAGPVVTTSSGAVRGLAVSGGCNSGGVSRVMANFGIFPCVGGAC